MDRTDIEYILHCVKNSSELIYQGEGEKAKGLLLSAELLLSKKLTTDNSDYAKCSHELLDNLLGNYSSEQHMKAMLILKSHFA